MSKNRGLQRSQQAIRVGEGYAVNATRTSVDPDGRVNITLDLSMAPVSERTYWTNAAGVRLIDDSVQLLFGQKQLTGNRLRSLLVITISIENAQRFLASCIEFRPDLDKVLKDIAPSTPFDFSGDEPSQTVALTASILSTARSGNESSIDFYYVSPRMLADFARTQMTQLAVEAVVRVTLSTSLIAMLIDEIGNVCRNVKPLGDNDG